MRPHRVQQLVFQPSAYGAPYGAVSPDVASSLISTAGTLLGVGVGAATQASQAKKEREHQEKMAHQQMLAGLLAPPQLTGGLSTGTIIGIVGGVATFTLGGMFLLIRSDRKKAPTATSALTALTNTPVRARKNILPLIPIAAIAIAGVIAANSAKKQREHEKETQKRQGKQEQQLVEEAEDVAKMRALEAEQLAIVQAEQVKMVGILTGAVVLLGLGGMFVYMGTR